MPEFAHSWFLALLPLAVLAPWAWLRSRRASLRWPDVRPLAALPPGRCRRARIGGAVLRGLGIAALVVALAGPRWPDRGTRISADGIAIVIALDVSGSMAETDVDWDGARISRLEAARRALRPFILGDSRAADRIGVVAFAAQPDAPSPLTHSLDVVVKLLDAEEPRSPPDTGTNIGDAIVWSLRTLARSGARRNVIVLVSDGEHNVPPPALTPQFAAELAAQQGVTIYTIDAGPPINDANAEAAAARRSGQDALAAAAEITGGKSFRAHDAAAMRDALAAIDRLERTPAESFQFRRYAEGFPTLAIAALACFLLLFGLESTVWRRTP